MTLSEIDKLDIRESFRVMDGNRSGCLSIQTVHKLYLGLGFEPVLKLQDWKARINVADDDSLNVEACLNALEQFHRDRDKTHDNLFRVLDTKNKGYFTASDIADMSSTQQQSAERMVEYFGNDHKITRADMETILHPLEENSS